MMVGLLDLYYLQEMCLQKSMASTNFHCFTKFFNKGKSANTLRSLPPKGRGKHWKESNTHLHE